MVGGITSTRLMMTATLPPQTLAIEPSAQATMQSKRDVFYFSDRFGFRLVVPSGYVSTPSESQPSTQPAKPLQVLELWEQRDFANRATLMEAPPLISLTVYQNISKRPLSAWKGELSRPDDRPLTVAGQPAIAYISTGLYESDNVLLSTPDGRYVIRLSASYMDAQAPIRRDFQAVLSSLTFDVQPDAKAASGWQINYTRLQTLLKAKDWQAANLETQAILQRLAGPKGDLLFNSKSVFARLPLADLQTLDRLWSNASGGRFGFSAQQRVWQQVSRKPQLSRAQIDQFAKRVGWRRSQPLPEDNPVGMELSGIQWRLDTELDYSAQAPAGHLPWLGVSSIRLREYLAERSLGCGSCTVDAIYLAGDRFNAVLPALMTRFTTRPQ